MKKKMCLLVCDDDYIRKLCWLRTEQCTHKIVCVYGFQFPVLAFFVILTKHTLAHIIRQVRDYV